MTAGHSSHHGWRKLTDDIGIFTGIVALRHSQMVVVYQVTVFPDSQMIVSEDMSWYKIKGRAKIIGLYWCVKNIPQNRDQWEHKLQSLGWP